MSGIQEFSPMNTVSGFKYAWMRLIAKAWSNEEFNHRLLSANAADVRNLFRSVGDFDVPDDMYIMIFDPQRHAPEDIMAKICDTIHMNSAKSPTSSRSPSVELFRRVTCNPAGKHESDDDDAGKKSVDSDVVNGWGWDRRLQCWLLPSAIVLLPMPPRPTRRKHASKNRGGRGELDRADADGVGNVNGERDSDVELDGGEIAVALAEYQWIGRSLPLSCC